MIKEHTLNTKHILDSTTTVAVAVVVVIKFTHTSPPH